ncbi:hypothetical protein BOQ60_25555, partial [Chryseobacterium sp. CH1]
GGNAPVYENLLIKGNNVHYSLEGQGKKYKQDFKISDEVLVSCNSQRYIRILISAIRKAEAMLLFMKTCL